MRRLVGLSLVSALGCTGADGEPATTAGDGPATPSQSDARQQPGPPGGRPGDGQGPRRTPDGKPTAAQVEPTAKVANTASGAELAVYVDAPESDGEHSAIVMVPGGTRDGATLLPRPAIQQFVDHGYVVVRYDPDGRGNSGGEEDLGGAVHQAALQAVIRYAIDRPDVAGGSVGVISYSFGIAAAAGALADGDSGAVWLIDWEGPVDRASIAGCGAESAQPFHGHDCDDEAFWSEREAVRSLSKLPVPYQRFQSTRDHVHGADGSHATRALEAVAASGVWLRLNDGDSGSVTADLLETGRGDRDKWLVDYADDLFAVVAGQPVQPHEHVAAEGPPGGRGGKAPGGRPRGGGRQKR